MSASDRRACNFTGVRVEHAATGLTVFGAIDELWSDAGGLHYVVDYKATSKNGEVVTCPELGFPRLCGHFR